MKQLLVLLLVSLSLSACVKERIVYRDRPVEVKIAVPQPCATKRPEEPKRAGVTIPKEKLQEMDIVQKIAYVGIDLEHSEQYGKDLNAATAACPEIKE